MSINPNDDKQSVFSSSQDTYRPSHTQVANPTLNNVVLTFQDLFRRYKTVLMHPSVATFDAELPEANTKAVLLGAGVFAGAWTFFLIVASLASRSAFSSGPTLGLVIGGFLVFFFAFFISVGVYQLLAMPFGGTGSYLPYAYLISLAIVPTEAIGAVLLIIPVLGILVLLAASIYGLYLMVLATQSAQRVTPGKAWAIVMIPSAASVLLACLFPFLLVAFLVIATPH